MGYEELQSFMRTVDSLPPHVQGMINADRLRERMAVLEAAPTIPRADGGRDVTKEWIDAFWPVVEAMDDALAIMAEWSPE